MALSRKEVCNLPNFITLLRFLCLFPVWYLISSGRTEAGLAVYLFGWATDWADGEAARRRDQVTEFGQLFDPLVDKIYLWGMVLLVSIPRFPVLVWLLWLLFVEDVVLALMGCFVCFAGVKRFFSRTLGVYGFTAELGANKWGKRKAVLFGFAIALFLLGDLGIAIHPLVPVLAITLAVVAAALSIRGHLTVRLAHHEERSTRSAWLD